MKHFTFVLLAVLVVSSAGIAPRVASADTHDTAPWHHVLTIVHGEDGTSIGKAYAGTNKAAATRVRKAFLKAKKAFHEARQEIQAIRKGDESPAKDLPTFFGEDDEESDEDDYQEEDGHEVAPG